MNPSLDYAKARETMVEQQVRPWDVLDARVLDVLATVPREAFFAEAHSRGGPGRLCQQRSNREIRF